LRTTYCVFFVLRTTHTAIRITDLSSIAILPSADLFTTEFHLV
jgi:hypothetical protein